MNWKKQSLLLILVLAMIGTAFARDYEGNYAPVPWYITFPMFFFSFVFRFLFSYWGIMLIVFVIFPLFKDRIWLMNRKQSFLRSQKNALVNPRDADARFQLGSIYLKGKSYRQAEKYFREAVSIDPANSAYQFSLARALQKRKQYNEAIQSYMESLKLNQNTGYGDAQLGLGNCYHKLNQDEKARDWFDKATQENSSLAESYFKLALLNDRTGNKNSVQSLLRECKHISATSSHFLKGRNRIWGLCASTYPLSKLFF